MAFMKSEDNSGEPQAPPASGAKASMRVCARCGAAARRAEARFCSACGVPLDETYLPADALRASYNLQRRRLSSGSFGRAGGKPPKSSMSSTASSVNSSGVSGTGQAFVTYSLVPYLGILFSPGALLLGGVGVYNSYRGPARGARRSAYINFSLGLLIFVVQIFLLWLLYKIPEWAQR